MVASLGLDYSGLTLAICLQWASTGSSGVRSRFFF
jgi:hypothetical protein